MIETSAIHWLAGLLEGEGGFTMDVSVIQLHMTDEDVVRRAAAILGTTRITRRRRRTAANPKWKDSFHCAVGGAKAAGWLMTLYQLLGIRRKGQAVAMLRSWRRRALHSRERVTCPRGHPYDGKEGIRQPQRYCKQCRTVSRRAARAQSQAQGEAEAMTTHELAGVLSEPSAEKWAASGENGRRDVIYHRAERARPAKPPEKR